MKSTLKILMILAIMGFASACKSFDNVTDHDGKTGGMASKEKLTHPGSR